MFKTLKILLTTLFFMFSSVSFAENATDGAVNPSVNQINERIDINNADVDTLSLLKGIGMKKAEAIISYRNENGKFTSVEDLLNVKGIGKQVLALNKKKLTI